MLLRNNPGLILSFFLLFVSHIDEDKDLVDEDLVDKDLVDKDEGA